MFITSFAQQMWVDKINHQKAHKILYKKKYIVNLSSNNVKLTSEVLMIFGMWSKLLGQILYYIFQ